MPASFPAPTSDATGSPPVDVVPVAAEVVVAAVAEPKHEVEAAEPKHAEPLREVRELLHEAQAVPQVRGSALVRRAALIRGAALAIHWLLQELIPGFAQVWNSPPCAA
jgi:hypothetical protein